MGKKLVLETTAPFQGLAELVAYDEGLFDKEELTITWADREKDVDKTPQLHLTSHKGVDPFPATASSSRRARRISITPASGATIPASATPASRVARSAAARS
jgi:hypothetical protein